jgi:CDP-6-deoxy-D-xylo-4-hexulose-3-dehydrase
MNRSRVKPPDHRLYRKAILAWGTLHGERVLEAERPFSQGKTRIPVSGKVVGTPELLNLLNAALDGWWTEGEWTDRFEKALAAKVGVRFASFVNSGSSANLALIAALTCGDTGLRRLRPGDEVVTCTVGFPTTLSAILWNRLTPVLVDVDPANQTYVPSEEQIQAAVTKRTAAVFLAHTLGNPAPITRSLRTWLRERDILILEDNCDAFGSELEGELTGRLGDGATLSFYPAHHITTGEGGAVLMNSPKVRRAVESVRDWGRSCWCPPGEANTCGKRFGWKLPGEAGFHDHKYIYDRWGFNLKSTDLQAAIGLAQLERLPDFVAARRANFGKLWKLLADLGEFIVLPEATKDAWPSWFGFPIMLRDRYMLSRDLMVRFLDSRNVDSRHLFAGNLAAQPAFRDVADADQFPGAQAIMRRAFWVGVWPGMTDRMLEWTAVSIRAGIRAQIGTSQPNGRRKNANRLARQRR